MGQPLNDIGELGNSCLMCRTPICGLLRTLFSLLITISVVQMVCLFPLLVLYPFLPCIFSCMDTDGSSCKLSASQL